MKSYFEFINNIAVFFIIFWGGVSFAVAKDTPERCKTSDHLGAIYSIEKTVAPENKLTKTIFALWKNNNLVAHDYRDRNITLVWNKTTNNRLRVVQAFNEHQRSIEYEPETQKSTNEWQHKVQFFSPQLIQNMTLVETFGNGCDLREKYQLTIEGQKQTLEWLPAFKRVSSYTVETPQGKMEWRLDNLITEKAIVEEAFNRWYSYPSTDYADIGDNESDPFLLKMINLGFIEHGSDGFYNAKGQSMGGQHNHHGH